MNRNAGLALVERQLRTALLSMNWQRIDEILHGWDDGIDSTNEATTSGENIQVRRIIAIRECARQAYYLQEAVKIGPRMVPPICIYPSIDKAVQSNWPDEQSLVLPYYMEQLICSQDLENLLHIVDRVNPSQVVFSTRDFLERFIRRETTVIKPSSLDARIYELNSRIRRAPDFVLPRTAIHLWVPFYVLERLSCCEPHFDIAVSRLFPRIEQFIEGLDIGIDDLKLLEIDLGSSRGLRGVKFSEALHVLVGATEAHDPTSVVLEASDETTVQNVAFESSLHGFCNSIAEKSRELIWCDYVRQYYESIGFILTSNIPFSWMGGSKKSSLPHSIDEFAIEIRRKRGSNLYRRDEWLVNLEKRVKLYNVQSAYELFRRELENRWERVYRAFIEIEAKKLVDAMKSERTLFTENNLSTLLEGRYSSKTIDYLVGRRVILAVASDDDDRITLSRKLGFDVRSADEMEKLSKESRKRTPQLTGYLRRLGLKDADYRHPIKSRSVFTEEKEWLKAFRDK